MTPKKEDYLKIIFELGGTKKKVSNKQIAMSLNVAAGSVTEMVNKLVKEGLAAHTPYAGISLTDEGIEVAEKLVRRHRLWETFLVEKLDYQLSEVHDEAEVLEHVASDSLLILTFSSDFSGGKIKVIFPLPTSIDNGLFLPSTKTFPFPFFKLLKVR